MGLGQIARFYGRDCGGDVIEDVLCVDFAFLLCQEWIW